MIRLFDGREIATTTKDISPSEARLMVPADTELPDHFMFRIIGRAFVCAARVAWRRGANVGVCIERIGKLKAKPAGPARAEGAPRAPQQTLTKRFSWVSRF